LINLDELEKAIEHTQGEPNPNAYSCIKLAAYYICRTEELKKRDDVYSFSPAVDIIEPEYSSSTAFGRAIRGKDTAKVMAFLDNLISTSIQYILPQMYADILRIVRAM
jgi:hypothetical protein